MKIIKLTCGKTAFVDDEDFDKVQGFTWYGHLHGRIWYARTNLVVGGVRTTRGLHQIILPGHKQIDHKNGNGLDCQKHNLRPAEGFQNQANSQKRNNQTSQFKGVSRYRDGRRWKAHIHRLGKQIHLGLFENEIDAAQAYDRKAVELFGEFAKINLTTTGQCANILDRNKPATNKNMTTYKIVRSYHPSLNQPSEVIDTGLTLAEAQAHCSDPSTREPGVYFDGYDEE